MERVAVVWADKKECTGDRYLSGMLAGLKEEFTSRYHFLAPREETIIGRLLLCSLLPGMSLSVLMKNTMYSATGKPYLQDGSRHFSISHSGDLVIAACSDHGEIGIDTIETIRMKDQSLSFLHPDEKEAYDSSEDKTAYLGGVWTKKEAISKLTGQGWVPGFSGINTEYPVINGQLFRLGKIDIHNNYSTHIASEEQIMPVLTRLSARQLISRQHHN